MLNIIPSRCTTLIIGTQTIETAHQDQTPYMITIELENDTINQGEDLVLLIGIQPDEGFNSTVEMDLELFFVGHNLTLYMFPLYPPFPRMQEATIEIPPQAGGGEARGILIAFSGEYVVEKEFQFTLVDQKSRTWQEPTFSWLPYIHYRIWSSPLLPPLSSPIGILYLVFRDQAKELLEGQRYFLHKYKLFSEISNALNEYIEQVVKASEKLASHKYVGDKKSKLYHDINCNYTNQISFLDKIYFSSKEDAESAGYVSCNICNP
jgi:hypothetical protein